MTGALPGPVAVTGVSEPGRLIDTYPGGRGGGAAEPGGGAGAAPPAPMISLGANIGFWTCCHRSFSVPKTPPPEFPEPYVGFWISGT